MILISPLSFTRCMGLSKCLSLPESEVSASMPKTAVLMFPRHLPALTSYVSCKDSKTGGKDESWDPCLASPTPKDLSLTPTPSLGLLRGS